MVVEEISEWFCSECKQGAVPDGGQVAGIWQNMLPASDSRKKNNKL